MSPLATTTDVAIVILAGGRATRFPGKLEIEIGGEPLLARVYNRVRELGPVTIAGRGTFSAPLDAALDCPIVVDRWPDRGPLGGLLSAALGLRAAYLFAVAGDAPMIDAHVLRALRDAWQPGDEAVVPVHEGRMEPLAALYNRAALIREAHEAISSDDRSMHGVLARLRVRQIPIGAQYFVNVNTAADAASMRTLV